MKEEERMSNEEMSVLIREITYPTGNFLVKRIKKTIFQNQNTASISINYFIAIIIGSLAIINASILQWIGSSVKEKTGKEPDMDALRLALMKKINDKLGIKIN